MKTSSVYCRTCGYESKTTGHPDQLLSVPISSDVAKPALPELLEKYMIEVVDDYRCNRCDVKSNKERVLRIDYSPNILTVQLKRFQYDGSKVKTAVAIPTTLDLDKYRGIDNPERMRYELTAVIKHSGRTEGGHYICCTKAGDGQWYCFDDREMSKGSVVNATNNTRGGNPYVLFYQRREL